VFERRLCVRCCIPQPRARRCPWPKRGETKHARLPQREPGPGSTAPGTSSPTPVLRPSPSPHGRLRCSLSLFLSFCFFVPHLPSLAVYLGLPLQAPLAVAASSLRLLLRRAFLLDHHSFLLCPTSSISTADRRRTTALIPSPASQLYHIAGSVCLPADAWLLDQLHLPIR
jgi:hypothetical protein